MIMDIAVMLIFVLSIFFSMKNGLIASIANFSKGFVSVIVAYIFCDSLALYVINNTPIGDAIVLKFSSHLSEKIESSPIYQTLPDLFKSGTDSVSSGLIASSAQRFADIAITILCFAVILFSLRFILGFVSSLLRKSRIRKGFFGTLDRFLGLALGVITGQFYVYLFLALIFPVVGILMPSRMTMITGWFNGSFYAQDFYDNNLLLLMFRYLLK